MNAGTRWVLAIVGLLVGNVLAGVILIVAAHSGASQVLPGYYDKAIHYDDAIDQAAQNRALGWAVATEIDHGVVTTTVRDRAGVPVQGAHVRIEGYARAHVDRAIDGELPGDGAGVYRAPRAHDAGWHDLTITVERGGARFVQHLAVEAR